MQKPLLSLPMLIAAGFTCLLSPAQR